MTNRQVYGRLAAAVFGLLLLVAGLQLDPSPPVQAQNLPPRPTRQPTVQPTSKPTTQPTTGPTRQRRSNHNSDRVPLGQITGTVIDQVSGQPLAGVGVEVGTVIVISDANGNYRRENLATGIYQVELSPAQGSLVGGPFQIALARDATAIQHLTIRRPGPRMTER